ncbi:MAG: ABC transporter permease subunit [Clostridiales bacterium]|nr:ABC transporter permease subunit [Clostridiales bacterium]
MLFFIIASAFALFALGASLAAYLWPAGYSSARFESGGVIASAAFGASRVYSTSDNKVFCLNADGERRWEFQMSGSASALDAAGGAVYVGLGSGRVVLISEDGEQTGVLDTGSPISALRAADGLLAVANAAPNANSIKVYSLSALSLLAELTLNSAANAIEIGGGRIYAATRRGDVYLVAQSDFTMKTVRLDGEGAALRLFGAGLLAADKSNGLYYIEDGAIALRDAFPGDNYSSAHIAVSGGTAAVGAGNALSAFDTGLKKRGAALRLGGTIQAVYADGDRITAVLRDENATVAFDALRSVAVVGVFKTAAPLSAAAALAVSFVLAVFAFDLRRVKAAAGLVYKKRRAYIMLLPTFALLILFALYPAFQALVMAFTDWSAASRAVSFVGLDNFRLMVSEGYFLIGIKNTLLFLASYFIKVLTVPLGIAALVFSLRNERAKYWLRFFIVLPMIVPSIVMILMWRNIFDPSNGLINTLLRGFGQEGLTRAWLADERTALWSLMLVGFPFLDAFSFLIYYGGLISIGGEVIEAGRLDGAKGLRMFFSLYLPLIKAQIATLLLLGFIAQLQDFNLVLVLTKGGPGTKTYLPGYELYLNATAFGRYGYACALGLLMFVAIFIPSFISNYISDRRGKRVDI